ncbi:hypothetical protein [Arhodomonas sp. SL1]|uniref:hypothetical protein n=1 Tax=Arhodomonas sp. SL1 TaxID=3425691 RepID=UPI003F8850F4
MTKTLIISHGDKGGCGKSTVATIIGSRLLEKGTPFVLIEADAGEGSGGQPDVAPRFTGRDNVQVTEMSMRQEGRHVEDMIAKMFGAIENWEQEYILMNTPANASATLEYVGDLIAAAVEEMGIDLRVAYSFDRSDAAVANAAAAAKGHILRAATHAAFVVNEHFGIEAEYARKIDAQKAMRGYARAVVPALSPGAADQLLAHPGANLADLSDHTGPLHTMQRLQVARWYGRAAGNVMRALALEGEQEADHD